MHRITELEEQLYADSNGAHRKQLLAALDEEKKNLQKLIQLGCTPAEYSECKLQLSAIEHAQTVINMIWRVYHGMA